jgi:outer membrane protein assembly factor BamB
MDGVTRIAARVALAIAVLLTGGAMSIAGCGGASPPALRTGAAGVLATAGTWPSPNGDLSNTRDVGGPIDQETVSKLEAAWTLPIDAASLYGGYAAAPIVVRGIVYSQDLDSNVQAISLQTGRVLWSKRFDSPNVGPDGVTVADGRVFGATATSAFSLDQRTGRQLWSVPLVRNDHEGIDMAPGYHDGIVYVSTVPGNTQAFYSGNGVGILWALNSTTGKALWHFNTVPNDLWSPQHVSINSGGGLWNTPAFDNQGYMYFGVGNPGPFPGTNGYPWGSSRPGPNLYTDSLVKLDARTGRLQWYYQLTPHDIYDWDLQDPPILTHADGRAVVMIAGKAGVVLCLDRQTGKLLWRRAVGLHNGHDKDSTYAMNGEYSKLRLAEPVYPGRLGGVEAPMATNGGTLFVPVVNSSITYSSQTTGSDSPSGDGELVALNTSTGAVRWAHRFPSVVYGSATVVNDLVFTTTFDGSLYALSASTGRIVWQTRLPAGTIAGVTIAGNTVIAAAGSPQASNQSREIVAFRIPAGKDLASRGMRRPPASPRKAGSGVSVRGRALSGATIFSRNCAVCHTLAAAGATGTIGPNLDDLRPSMTLVIHQVFNGGGVMPSFARLLSPAQIRAVAQFVASEASGHSTPGLTGGGAP